jgi:HEAT repeat protein
VTGARKRSAGGEGYEQWSFWWENNKDRFLNLKAKIQSGGIVTGDAGYHLGRGTKAEASKTSLRPTEAQIAEQVIPALERALTDDDFDTRAAALIGLGKCGRDAGPIEAMKKLFTDNNKAVRESVGLGLGILGNAQAIPILLDLMNDTQAGRQLVGRQDVEVRTRAFAAIGLGLIEDRSAVPYLKEVVAKSESYSQPDVPAAAVHALGLLGDKSVVPDLIAVLDNPKTDKFVQAAVPIALGKIGDPAAASKLEAYIKNDKVDDLVRWSAIIGYSRLMKDSADDNAVKVLTIIASDAGDPQTRNFATMGLAYVGGDAAKASLLKFFRTAQNEQLPWVSMAAAVYSWEKDLDQTVVDQVRRAFQEQKNPSWKAGHAVALGLLKDKQSSEMLLRELASSNHEEYKGYLCIALGLMEATDAMPQIKSELEKSRSFPKLQQQAAIGLGLMGDKDVVTLLAGTMEKTDSAYVLGSTAIALGLIGDRNAIDPMVRIAGNPDVKKIGRALATVGLGIIGDKDPLPRLTRVSEDNNYRAKADFMQELLTIL